MPEPIDPEAQLVSEYQNTVLLAAERFFGSKKIPKLIRRAFLDTPRHKFLPRFYSSQRREWMDLATVPLREHLPELYADHPLSIHRDENGRSLSTISQPSLVIYMLDLLDLSPGLNVFELGGGSGWNAALMGRLVGPSGRILSFEIIESLVAPAQATLGELGLQQVDFRFGDASEGSSEEARFDRGVFTASAWELPSLLFQQIKEQGLLLFVVKAQPHYDLLCLLRKAGPDQFVSELHFPCAFVPVTGKGSRPESQANQVDTLTDLPLNQTLSWDAIKLLPEALPAFLEFAKLVFDCQQSYLLPNAKFAFDEEFWGTRAPDSESLLLFNEDRLLLFGSEDALISLRRAAKRWQKADQPSTEELSLSIHKLDTAPNPSNDQWLVPRGNCALLWSL